MKTTLTKSKTYGIITAVFSIIVFIWFSSIDGMLGTFHWHTDYKTLYAVLSIFLLIHIAALILDFFLKSKILRVVLLFFSTLNTIVWLGFFVTLTALTSVPVDNSKLNILSQKEEIPLNHIALASDPHWGSAKSDKEARVNILNQVNSNNYDAFFILGDITEMGMLAGDHRLATADLGNYLTNTPFRAIPGNHDAVLNGLELYDKIYMNKGDKHYFRMDSGSVHLLFIKMLWDSTEFSNKQCRWLENQLKEIPQEDTVIVLSHCYAVSSGYYDPVAKRNWGDLKDVMKKLCPILEKYKVDLHISGHDHFFEYLEKDDVSYMVLGTMGGALDENLIYTSPYSKYLCNSEFGYVDMKIFDSYLTVDFISQNGHILFTKKINTK